MIITLPDIRRKGNRPKHQASASGARSDVTPIDRSECYRMVGPPIAIGPLETGPGR
jgi:hypothetical protein